MLQVGVLHFLCVRLAVHLGQEEVQVALGE